MNISAETVKELRERTGAGMMDCKRALADSNGDVEKALEALRKQGLAKAAKKIIRTAAEGLIGTVNTGNAIVLAEVYCETDFVCKTDEFQKFVKEVTAHIAKTAPKDMDALLASTMNGKKLSDLQTELIAKIGENLGVKRFSIKPFDNKAMKAYCYIHAGSKIGVVATFEDPSGKMTEVAGKDVAMHVAAMSPQYIRKSDVPESVLAKEKEVFAAQMVNEKKPPEVMEKIILGKVSKYLSEICLEDQIFVRDPSGKQTVGQMLKAVDPSIKIKDVVRLQVGEGVSKG
jgi:elongation factor Ts